MDNLTKDQRTHTMRRIRSTDTKFERVIFCALRKRGVYFRRNYSRVVGKPDIAVPSLQRAVFLHSDFWHGWQLSRWEADLPNDYWKEKLRRNRLRDRVVLRRLRRLGWDVLVVWEHQIAADFDGSLDRIGKFLRSDG